MKTLNTLFNCIKWYFIVAGVVLTLLLVLTMNWITRTKVGKTQPLPDKDIALHVVLKGNISFKKTNSNLIERFMRGWSHKDVYLPDLQSTLKSAANDKKVKALAIEYLDLSASIADIHELQKILLTFKKSGKPIYIWVPKINNASLLLMSSATKIFVPQSVDIALLGPMLQFVFLKDALDKLGVGINVVRTGKYKSALERFSRNNLSYNSLQMYNSLEKSLRQELLSSIHEAKPQWSLEQLNEWFNNMLVSTKTAANTGMFDSIGYWDELVTNLNKQYQTALYPLDDYRKSTISTKTLIPSFKQADGIALIELSGEIHEQDQGIAKAVITPKQVQPELKWARTSDNVKAVVLRIESPGGSMIASDLIWRKIERLAAVKPVVVSMGDVAASGGYYIALPAHKIIADPMTITGSIGVITLVANLKTFQRKYGISFESINQGEHSRLFDLGKIPNKDDIAVLQSKVDDAYDIFTSKVVNARKSLIKDKIDKVAQGRVWTGAQAQKNGLVDALGGLSQAIDAAKKLASIPLEQKTPLLKWVPEIESIFDCLRSAKHLSVCLAVDKLAVTQQNWLLSPAQYVKNVYRSYSNKVMAIMEVSAQYISN